MVLTVSLALSPVIGLFCHCRRRDAARDITCVMRGRLRRLDAGVEASGPHDFFVRSGAVRLTTSKRPSHPAPASVAIARAPLFSEQDGRSNASDLASNASRIFFADRLDALSSDLPVGQLRLPSAIMSRPFVDRSGPSNAPYHERHIDTGCRDCREDDTGEHSVERIPSSLIAHERRGSGKRCADMSGNLS